MKEVFEGPSKRRENKKHTQKVKVSTKRTFSDLQRCVFTFRRRRKKKEGWLRTFLTFKVRKVKRSIPCRHLTSSVTTHASLKDSHPYLSWSQMDMLCQMFSFRSRQVSLLFETSFEFKYLKSHHKRHKQRQPISHLRIIYEVYFLSSTLRVLE